MDFVTAGTAAMAACLFTNPLDTLKTRMQLQGELSAKGAHAIHYRNVAHACYVVAKNDGIAALQKGLLPALWIQFIMNGFRLGTFQFGESNGLITDKNGNLVFYKSVLVGGTGGVVGQFLASPFFLVKTHLQSRSAAAIAVGHQHRHRGSWNALKTIHSQHGIKGLFRGAVATFPRAFVGSVAQLSGFKYTKEYLNQYEYFKNRKFTTSFCGSLVAGVGISVAMAPFDLISTRIYNQPVDLKGKGLMYTSYINCVTKIFQTEGLSAFYKGIGPLYLRLGPHSVLCLVFWDELKELQEKFLPKEIMK